MYISSRRWSRRWRPASGCLLALTPTSSQAFATTAAQRSAKGADASAGAGGKLQQWNVRFGTQRASSGATHKRAEGRAPVWGSEFTTKAATQRGIRRIGAQPFCSGLLPSFTRAITRVWFTRLPGLKSSPSGDLGPQRRSRPRARQVARGKRQSNLMRPRCRAHRYRRSISRSTRHRCRAHHTAPL